jgi:transcription termination factor NusA
MQDEHAVSRISAAIGLDARAVQVELYPLFGKAIVALTEITEAVRARNRYANVETEWDIFPVTPESLARIKATARTSLAALPGISLELAERLVGEGVFSCGDLASVDSDDLARLTGFDAARVEALIDAAMDAALMSLDWPDMIDE